MKRKSIGSKGTTEDEEKTTGKYVFLEDEFKKKETDQQFPATRKKEILVEGEERQHITENKVGTPVAIKCISENIDLVLTRDAFYSSDIREKGDCKPLFTYQRILDTLKEQNDRSLDDLIRNVEWGLEKLDFSGFIDVTGNGEVYLTIVRERHSELEDRTLFKYIPAGLYHLKFNKGYTEVEEITVMQDWRPTKTKVVGERGKSRFTLYAAEGNEIYYREYDGATPMLDTIRKPVKLGLEKDDMIIDFDVLGSSIAVVTENK